MLQVVMRLEDISSLKDKRRIVRSLIDRIRHKFPVSAAEVDLLDSLSFAQIGAALVCNDAQYGDQVLQKIIRFLEQQAHATLYAAEVHSEEFGS
jgi:uncharacterized protein